LRARGAAGGVTRAALERIVDTTAQVNRLVEDLLTLARSDAVALDAEMTMVDVDRLVRDVAEDARALGAANRLHVDCAVPERPVSIRGDPERLRQALLILVDNASRYTPAGGQIAITLAADGADAVLTVADSGVGIPPDELALVADRFYRGSNVGDVGPPGAGLGLHIAKSIIEAHGGAIDVASEPGHGTRVTLRLPLCLASVSGIRDERAAG
jgi:signal transduction histidine kinase